MHIPFETYGKLDQGNLGFQVQWQEGAPVDLHGCHATALIGL